MSRRLSCCCIVAILLTACSASPQRTPSGDRNLSLQTAREHPAMLRGQRVEWGGVLVESRNLRRHSELEILAYPLLSNGRPDLRARPTGRFLGVRQGYLETIEYAAGRLVTVSGPLAGVRYGHIGDSTHTLPLVEIADIELWRHDPPAHDRPRIHFGISGGNRGTSVGVGVGF